uniref:Uncharacterized protein n=1 Tax=Pipistrellus kuhlii TaxID=59472 RepID=A0A7J7Y9B5_PIPKU|nr:hypothetical protein mPipKuh1_010359 [Pipistrellus kuhlii]
MATPTTNPVPLLTVYPQPLFSLFLLLTLSQMVPFPTTLLPPPLEPLPSGRHHCFCVHGVCICVLWLILPPFFHPVPQAPSPLSTVRLFPSTALQLSHTRVLLRLCCLLSVSLSSPPRVSARRLPRSLLYLSLEPCLAHVALNQCLLNK